MDILTFLVSEYNKDRITLHMICNGVDYDEKFAYNPNTGVLIACSSTQPSESLGIDKHILEGLVRNGAIQITLSFKR